MHNKKIIFHYPGPFYDNLNTGEKKRPVKLYEAFKTFGCDVELINGPRRERTAKIIELLPYLEEFDFIYSENSNIPLGLCEDAAKHKLCLRPADFTLFKEAKLRGIPLGVFYRDFYWRCKFFRHQIGFLKYFASLFFYYQELDCYRQYAKTIFIPSQSCAALLPARDRAKCVPMPPGEEPHDMNDSLGFDFDAKLHLLYVGSIEPRKYDLQKLFDVVGELDLKLTLVTRREDWDNYKSHYNLPEKLFYAEAQGEQLAKYYRQANLTLYYLDDSNPYSAVRLPLKLFESIGYAIPMLSFGESEVSSFLKQNDCGWVVNSQAEAKQLLTNLAADLDPLREKHQLMLNFRNQHTWEKRAEAIAATLLN